MIIIIEYKCSYGPKNSKDQRAREQGGNNCQERLPVKRLRDNHEAKEETDLTGETAVSTEEPSKHGGTRERPPVYLQAAKGKWQSGRKVARQTAEELSVRTSSFLPWSQDW